MKSLTASIITETQYNTSYMFTLAMAHSNVPWLQNSTKIASTARQQQQKCKNSNYGEISNTRAGSARLREKSEIFRSEFDPVCLIAQVCINSAQL